LRITTYIAATLTTIAIINAPLSVQAEPTPQAGLDYLESLNSLIENSNQYQHTLTDVEKITDGIVVCEGLDAGWNIDELNNQIIRDRVSEGNPNNQAITEYQAAVSVSSLYHLCPNHKKQLQ
jgi:hypothetical protein